MEISKESNIIKEYFDTDEFEDNLDFIRNIMNLKEFEIIFKNNKLIETEFLLFLSEDLPQFIPFYFYIDWKLLEPYKADINNRKLINIEKLDKSRKGSKDIDLKFIDSIEKVKYNPYNYDNFKGDILNYIYDILYILSSGKVNMMRNKKYLYHNIQYDLDFQIVNLNLKHLLYFIGLLYPNILNMDTLDICVSNIFKTDENIFNRIDNLKIDEKLKEYEYIDILGEVTIDYLNISDKKDEQFEKYISLIKKLQSNLIDNKLFNFMEKNKKIIIVITHTKFENFCEKFKKKSNLKDNNDKNYINIDENNKDKNSILNSDEKNKENYLFIYLNKTINKSKVIREKLIFNYIKLQENKLEEYSKKDKKEENVLNKYKCLKLNEINNNFYGKINTYRQLESFRNCIKKINKNYLNKLPKLFFKHIEENLEFDFYEKQLKDIFNFQFNAYKIYEKLNNQYQSRRKK